MTTLDSELVAKVVEGLRRKLIDTSKRNRMLNFKHDERSRSQVRVVATTLDAIYVALVRDGRTLRFQALPQLDDEPEDEKAPEFRAALARARETDPEYTAGLLAAGDEPTRAARLRLERALRDRLRREQGMGDRPPSPRRPADHARRCGIDPSFDLGAGDTRPVPHLQTLLWHDRADAKLRAVL